jgi:hypothetical protein
LIQKYPNRTEPFVSQKSPKGRRGQGFGIGAIVFLFVLLGVLLAVLYLIPPLVDEMVFPDIGISYPTLFLIIIIGTVFVSIGLMFKDKMYVGKRIGYRERDPSQCQRVIRDGYDGVEIIISGSGGMTFAEACLADWQFKNLNQNSKWYIKDEHGNDVTEKTIDSTEGIFILVPEYEAITSKAEPNESDEYSSINDSVTYYD